MQLNSREMRSYPILIQNQNQLLQNIHQFMQKSLIKRNNYFELIALIRIIAYIRKLRQVSRIKKYRIKPNKKKVLIQFLVMSSNLFQNDFIKKPSREQRKLQQAIRLIDKMEKNPQKNQNKKRNHQSNLLCLSQPKKKVKTEVLNCQTQSSFVTINQLQSSSYSSLSKEIQPIKKPKTIINDQYLNGQKSDLYSHLLQYELNEKQKYFEIIHGDALKIENLPTIDLEFTQYAASEIQSMNKIFQKLKSKFEQSRSRLSRPSSKDHKEFNSQFLNLQFLLS